ncbi:MAG: YfiR family protein [Rubrivivax sp.]|nr:MAG: YfiR family protein [Rubrivivax sp.]
MRPRSASASWIHALHRWLWRHGLGLALVLACGVAPAQAPKASAAEVKAAYLLKIPSFVEWPAAGPTSVDAPFVILVAGADDVMRALEELGRGARVMGRPVRIARWSAHEVPAAQLVYLGSGGPSLDQVLDGTHAASVLLVSDRPSGLAEGAALHFVEDKGRIRFEASPENAAKQGVKLGARLLSVAARVEGSTP